MTAQWTTVGGRVVRGHRVASGACGDSRFPAGTIAPQLHFLREAITGFDAYLGGTVFPGTINLDLPNRTVVLRAPEIRVAAVRWTEHFAPENFLLSRCRLRSGGEVRPAFLYIPDHETKPDHHQASSVVEILCAFIPGLSYGAPADLIFQSDAIAVV